MAKKLDKELRPLVEADNLAELLKVLEREKINPIEAELDGFDLISQSINAKADKINRYLVDQGVCGVKHSNWWPLCFAAGRDDELAEYMLDKGADITLGKGERGVREVLASFEESKNLYYRIASQATGKSEKELKNLTENWFKPVADLSYNAAMEVFERVRKAGKRIDEMKIEHSWKDDGTIEIRVRYEDFTEERFEDWTHEPFYYVPVYDGEYDDKVNPILNDRFHKLAAEGYFNDIATDVLRIEGGHFTCTDPIGKPIMNTTYNVLNRFEMAKAEVMKGWNQKKNPHHYDYEDKACFVLDVLFRRNDLIAWNSDEIIKVAEKALDELRGDTFGVRIYIQEHLPKVDSLGHPLLDFLIWFGVWNAKSKEGERYVMQACLGQAIRLGSEKAKNIEKIGSGRFSQEEATLKSPLATGTANDVFGTIKLVMKDESEEAYGTVLDFINRLMERDFAPTGNYRIDLTGKGTKAKLNIDGMPSKAGVYRLFAGAVQYPTLYSKIRHYAELVMKPYTWYSDPTDEENCMPGTFAVYALGLNAPEHFDLVEEYVGMVDDEHQYSQRDFAYAFADKWGVNKATVPVLASCVLATTDLEYGFKEMYKSPALLRCLLENCVERDDETHNEYVVGAFFGDMDKFESQLEKAGADTKPYYEALAVCAGQEGYDKVNVEAVLKLPVPDAAKAEFTPPAPEEKKEKAAPAVSLGNARRFVYNDDKSSKFWQIDVQGESFVVTFGKIGTAGQTQQKDFGSEAECQKEADKLIREKTKKGYVEE